MAVSKAHARALRTIAGAVVDAVPAVDPDAYELPWEGMHNVAIACARVGAVGAAERAIAATEPPALRLLALACGATGLARAGETAAAKEFVRRAEGLLPTIDHAGVVAHALAELACAQRVLGQVQRSEKLLAEARRRDPRVRFTLAIAATVARAHVLARRWDEAEAALDAGPWRSGLPSVHNAAGELAALAVAYAEAGAWRRGVALADRVEEESGDDVRLHRDVVLGLARVGLVGELELMLAEMHADEALRGEADALMSLHGHSVESAGAVGAVEGGFDAALGRRDFVGALTELARAGGSDDEVDYMRSRFLDAAVDAFAPERVVEMLAIGPFRSPVAQAMDLWGALARLARFAFG